MNDDLDELLDELPKLLKGRTSVRLSFEQLRANVKWKPDLQSRKLADYCSVLIPQLLRHHKVHFCTYGKSITLASMAIMDQPTGVDFNHNTTHNTRL
jgi:hypothetical protein